jgi:N-acetylglucosamine-6-phosphate deacetylase
MSPLASRAPGMVGAALDHAESWCGVIADGHHVHPAAIRIALKAKPRGKIFFVTDAMPPVGADDPSFTLGGETITARDGICQTANGTLAGSALSMIEAIRNAVTMLGVPLEEAARMASTYPANFLGLGDTHGRIAPGCRANFTVIDAELRVTETWIDGVPQAN